MKKFIFLLFLLFLFPVSSFSQSSAPSPPEVCEPVYVAGVDPVKTGYNCVYYTVADSLVSAQNHCNSLNGKFQADDRPIGACGKINGYPRQDYLCFKKKSCPSSSSSSSLSSSSSSSSSSSASPCPSGKTRDSNNNCTTCPSPQVLNVYSQTCETKNECVWPERYQSLDNRCHPNPNNCAFNTGVNVITGGMCQQGPNATPYCPSGYIVTPQNTCELSSSQTSSSGSGSSSPPSTSSPSSSPSSSASYSSVRTNQGDNTNQNQDISNSQSIPAAISNADCLTSFSTSACTAMQNCQLTFGVNNCVGVTSNNTCPNSYAVNGQKLCVLSNSVSNSSAGGSSGSGSNGSQSGECDITSKDYLRCLNIKELQVPTTTGEFDGTAAAEALQEANEELQNKIDTIKSEINTALNVDIQGSGTIEDHCIVIMGKNVCFGFAKFTNQLTVISYAIMFLAYVLALFVILRK